MSPQERDRVKALLAEAARLPAAERRAFIETQAAHQPAIAAEAIDLLSLDDRFMAEPTGGGVAATRQAGPRRDDNLGAIGRYKLLRRLGAGGMGEVYLAQQQEPIRRPVALKVIKLGMDTREVVARFESERQALALMNHVNVAAVFDAGVTEQGRPYFVMEHVPGEPITAYCHKNRLTIPQRLHLFMQVCHAVQHAHTKGIIHRDIKPSNVLVVPTPGDDDASRGGTAGTVKVIDFGVAKATHQRLTDSSVVTQLGQLIGTPDYMSPEQAEMSQADIDTRTDIYSLGVLLYELLTGTLPFDPSSLRRVGLGEIQRIIREVDPPRPSARLDSRPAATPAAASHGPTGMSALRRQLRGDLDWIVMKCLEKDRTRRYETADGLALEIQRFLRNEPVLAGPPGTAYRLRKFVRRNRAGVLASTVLAAALLIATGVSLRFAAAEARQRHRAEEALASEAEQRRVADTARREAEQRQEETQQVADFQSSMLRGIDIEAMGRRLKQHLRDQVRDSLERQYVGEWPNRRKRTDEEVQAQLATFDQTSAPAQAADVARRVLDEFVLRRAGEAALTRFADQPLVQTGIREAIGSTYRAFGMLDAAEREFRGALETRRRIQGPEHSDVASALNNLASVLADKTRFDEAAALYRDALSLQRRLRPGDHPLIAASMNNLGMVLEQCGKLDEAEELVRGALAMHRRLAGEEHVEVATSLANLAIIVSAKGDLRAAEQLAREALSMRRRLFPQGSLDVSASLLSVSRIQRAQGDLAEAEELSREALAINRKLLGDEHPIVAKALNSLAELLRAKGDYAAAEPLYREALAIRRKLLGDDHLDVAASLNNLALLQAATGDQAAAEGNYRRALAICRAVLGDEHTLVATSLNNLGTFLHNHGDLADAERLLREALLLGRRLQGDDHPDVTRTMNNLGILLKDRGDLDGAEALIRDALARRRQRQGNEHIDVAATLNNLALVLDARRDAAGAEACYREALAIYRTSLGPDHPRLANCQHNLAHVLKERGEAGAAESLFREALAIRVKRLPAGHSDIAATRASLADAIVTIASDRALPPDARTAKLTEAEGLLLSAWEVLGRAATTAERMCQFLIKLYEVRADAEPQMGYDGQAAGWRAKLAALRATTQPAATQPTASR